MIDAELVFVAIFGQTSIFAHYACVAEQDIETLGLAEEALDGALNRLEGSLVAFQEAYIHLGVDRFDFLDHLSRASCIASGKVDVLW